ncbi:MAG: hypothetical protein ACREB2_01140 [Pseudolabrys sp.]
MARKAKKAAQAKDTLTLAEGIAIIVTLGLLGALGFGVIAV